MTWVRRVEIRTRQRFLVRFLFHLAEIFPKFTKTSGKLRQNTFDKLCHTNKNKFLLCGVIIQHTSKHILKDTHYYHMLEMDMLHVLSSSKGF